MKRVVVCIGLITCFVPLRGQQVRKYVNEFLHMGVGARAFAMGRAVVASTHDASAGYWNPAGLSALDNQIQGSFMHASYYQGLANYDYLSFAAKGAQNDGFGFGVLRFGVDGILNTLDLIQNGQVNYDRISTFSAADYGFFANYGKKLKIRYSKTQYSVGSGIKIIHRKVGPFARAWGFGFDAAFRAVMPKTGWSFAVVARDISSSFNAWEFSFTDKQKDVLALTGNTIPEKSTEIGLPRLIFGAAKSIRKDKWLLNTEFNMDLTTDGKRNTLIRSNVISIDPHLGAEWGYLLQEDDEKNVLFLRCGVYNLQREIIRNNKEVWRTQVSAGAGIRFGSFTLDYAISGFGQSGTGLYSNLISLRFGIDR
ncbi:MAG: hypothetical protein KJS92_01965 [Bacteroidetes bacterium]|nr:hypothetical protein [Bacteroidota bacterium]